MKIDLNVGMIEPYNEEKLGKQALGTSFVDLYDYINKLEVATGYNFPQIVAELKASCMQALGIIDNVNPEDIEQNAADTHLKTEEK